MCGGASCASSLHRFFERVALAWIVGDLIQSKGKVIVGSRIRWIFSDRLAVKCGCFLRISGLQILIGLTGLYDRRGLLYAFLLFLLEDIQLLACLILLSQRAKYGCKLKAGFARVGTQLERRLEFRFRFGRAAQVGQHEAQVISRFEVIGIDGHSLTQDLLGIRVVSQTFLDHAGKVKRIEIVGPAAQIIADDGRGGVELPKDDQGFYIREASNII